MKGPRLAAVSIIVRDKEHPGVLLIKRAKRSGDPWSGQIAFPGGKMQAGDGDARGTAVRETLEEVGIDLARVSEFLGYAPSTKTHTGSMDVVPSVFLLKEKVEARPNEEVTSYRWVGLGEVSTPGARSNYTFRFEGRAIEMPAFVVGDYVVWGLTHRILADLLSQD